MSEKEKGIGGFAGYGGGFSVPSPAVFTDASRRAFQAAEELLEPNRTVRVEIGQHCHLSESIPLKEAISDLQAVLDSTPPEFRDAVMLEIHDGECGSWMEFSYERPETVEDVNARMAEARRYEEESRRRDLRRLEGLAKQFGKTLT